MVLPCFGAIIAGFLAIGSLIKGAPIYLLLLTGAGLNGCLGKSTVIAMAVNSYMTDISTTDTRTEWLGRLLGANFFGIFCGSLLSGVLLQWFNFEANFFMVVIINGLAIGLIVVMLDETVASANANDEYEGTDKPDESASSNYLWSMVRHWIRSMRAFCSLANVRGSLSVFWKQRPRHATIYLLTFYAMISLHQASKVGEVDITLLYTQRSPLDWPGRLYSYFLSFDYACLGAFNSWVHWFALHFWLQQLYIRIGICLMFLLPFLTHRLQLDDTVLLILSIVTKIARLLLLSFSQYSWMVLNIYYTEISLY